MIKTTKLQEQRCPGCDALISAASDFGGTHAPQAGDYSVCAFCASFLIFENAQTVRLLSIDEIAALDDRVRIGLQRMRRAVETVHREGACLF